MALAVDQLPLGQIGTNCYLVRADRAATAAVVVDPGAEAAEIRLSLAGSGATCAALVRGGETVDAAGISFQVRHVPGHSPGHVSYYADGCLFSGDVLFAGSVGRTDLPFGDWDALLESIRSLAAAYPPETIVYSGHGPPTTLGDELARNPFLAELRA